MDLSKETVEDLKHSYANLMPSDEFELNLSCSEHEFMNIMEATKFISEKKKIKETRHQYLRVMYNDKFNKCSYRFEVQGVDNARNVIERYDRRANHAIFNNMMLEKAFPILKKEKISDDTVHLPEYNVKIRRLKEIDTLSKDEEKTLAELGHLDNLQILYRFLDRYSIVLEDTKEYTLKLECSSVQQNTRIGLLSKSRRNYEVEIEFVPKIAGKKLKTDGIKSLMDTITMIMQVKNQSKRLTTIETVDQVFKGVKNLLDRRPVTNLRVVSGVRKPVTLNIDHCLKKINRGNHAVTIKADGLRAMLYISEHRVYIVTTSEKVIDTEIRLKDSKFNNTLLDGEYIYSSKHKKFVFLVFDALFIANQDVRYSVPTTKYDLKTRFELAQSIVKEFGIIYNSDIKGNTVDALTKKCKQILAKNQEEILQELEKGKSSHVIASKFYIFPTGIRENEVYSYAYDLWTFYDKSPIFMNDGIIFTPMNQDYKVDVKESEEYDHEYKLKPVNMLSIDFYVKFLMNQKTGQPLIVYDNTETSSTGQDLMYYVGYLHSYQSSLKQSIEFRKDYGDHLVHLPIDPQTGITRDQEGNIIRSHSVVEFIYKQDNPKNMRWIPIRVRSDKSQGNGLMNATAIWDVIHRPIYIDEMKFLGDPSKYEEYQKLIVDRNVDNNYYTTKNNMALEMRAFHNFVKETLIRFYCSPVIVTSRKIRKSKRILDIGVGRGGDIEKYFRANANEVVAIDKDGSMMTKLNQKFNLIKKRYSRNKNNNTQFHFLVGDASIPLTRKDQEEANKLSSSANFKKYNALFDRAQTYDVAVANFSLHYFFESSESLNNFLRNIKRQISNKGYFVCTCFDGDKAFRELEQNDGVVNFENTDDTGDVVRVFGLQKMYTEEKIEDVTVGAAIDVYNGLINDSAPIREYLVRDAYLREVMNNMGFKCVDSGSFECMLNSIEPMFNLINQKNGVFDQHVAKHVKMVKDFMDLPDIDASKGFSFMNKFYVFQKVI